MVVDDAIVVLENIVRKRNEGMGVRAAAVIGTRGGVLRRHHHHRDACGGLHPDLVPARAGGRAVHRIRLRACFHGDDLQRCGADPLPDAGVAADQAARHVRRKFDVLPGRLWLGGYISGIFTPAAEKGAGCAAGCHRYRLHGGGPPWRCFRTIPQELTPPEDRAVALMRISAPQGVSLDYTRAKMTEIERLVSPLQRKRRSAERLSAIAGTGGSANNGFMVLTLAPWGERERSQAEIVGQVNGMPPCRACVPLPSSPTAWAFAAPATACSSPSSATATTNWPKSAQQMVEKLEQDPRFRQIRLSYETTQPQISVQIDRAAPPISASTSMAGRGAAGAARWPGGGARCSSRTAPIRSS
jgi:HAE1 family hydrophobic/amphiphilic exporter-1